MPLNQRLRRLEDKIKAKNVEEEPLIPFYEEAEIADEDLERILEDND